MALPVYSVRFISGNTGAGDPVYTVPAGFVAVLRDVDVYNNSAVVAELFLEDSQTGQAIARFDSQGPTDTGSQQWRGRQVFDAGGGFLFHATAGTWDVRACGYLLSAPP